jgi:MFS transporter, UMF1 family
MEITMANLLNRKTTSWCLYDWASSAYFTNVFTFILSVYFVKSIASDNITGTSHWAYASGLAALLIAIISPVLGSKVDHQGSSRSWFVLLTLITIVCTYLWWWVIPGTSHSAILALSLTVIGYTCAELAFVLYNGTLKEIAPATHVGRLSAYGFALGYAGGIVCLLLMLFILIENIFNLHFLSFNSRGVRAVGPATAIWFLVFSLPSFIFLKTKQKHTQSISIKQSIHTTINYVKEAWHDKNLMLFLVARLFFIDGLNTIFALAGIYAADLFGMSNTHVLYFALSSQVAALIGTSIFARLDDSIGPLTCLKINVSILALSVLSLFFIHGESLFWIVGMCLSTTIGPIQSCGRSYMTRISDPHSINKNFGLYAVSGKITAFLGPWLVGITTAITQSQRAGIVPVLVLIVIGLLLLLKLKPVER